MTKTEEGTLLHEIARRIRHSGPMTVAEYMAECLFHPRYGYYAAGEPIGARGDFITAPEISQIFGELLGLWVGAAWRQMGEPRPPRFVELGPGRGTLMADMLRALRVIPDFLGAATVHLVEASPKLAMLQRETLMPFIGEARLAWHRTLAEVPEGPLFLVANEFFDALPIHQFERRGGEWRERLVTLAAEGDGDVPALALALGPAAGSAAALIPETVTNAAREGDVAEVSPEALRLADALARRIAREGGAALIIDYGHARSAPGETWQAVRRHAYTHPLAAPGHADLTAHVDFAALARAAAEAGARILGPVTQGRFLEALGVRAREEILLARTAPADARVIRAGVARLIAPDAMGTLFKVMAVAPSGTDPLAGFP